MENLYFSNFRSNVTDCSEMEHSFYLDKGNNLAKIHLDTDER